MPLSVLGMVHGLAYIFFFNPTTFTIPFTSIELTNPLSFLYQTIWILVICSIVHYYIVPHLTALTALKQVDAEFEAVSASLKVPFYRTFSRVTFPICLPAILDIAPAAAMAMMIVYTSAGVRILHGLLTRGVARRTQAWRKPLTPGGGPDQARGRHRARMSFSRSNRTLRPLAIQLLVHVFELDAPVAFAVRGQGGTRPRRWSRRSGRARGSSGRPWQRLLSRCDAAPSGEGRNLSGATASPGGQAARRLVNKLRTGRRRGSARQGHRGGRGPLRRRRLGPPKS